MTEIRFKPKPTWHQSGAVDRQSGRPYLVAETPSALLIRLKGTRTVLELPWSMAFLRAAHLRASLDALQRVNKRRASNNVTRGRV